MQRDTATLCSWPRMFVESYTLTVLSKCTEGSFQTEKWTKTLTFRFHVFLESFCAFLGDGEQQVADGIGWMDGWDGHHG